MTFPSPVHDGIELEDIVQIAFVISKAAEISDPENEPIEVTSSTAFKKFWNNWNEAAEELHILTDDISKVRSIVAI